VAEALDVEGISQGDNGFPLGREIQLADILSFIKRSVITNVVWITTDVHYTAAHYVDPDNTAFPDFAPFWQFTSGALNAGAVLWTRDLDPGADRCFNRSHVPACDRFVHNGQ
jgi:phosphodiesterase/alkaline phosphatase D-like protein